MYLPGGGETGPIMLAIIMPDFDQLLARWRNAGVLDAQEEARIRTFEETQKSGIAGIQWQGVIALILGAILLACGVALFLSAHWDQFAPGMRFAIILGVVALVHMAGGVVRAKYQPLSVALHAVGTVATGAAILFTGQIFNMEGHWPAAILFWAVAAACGWLLLRDEVQQTLTLLLVPAWMMAELNFYMFGHIGVAAITGRVLFTWSILYLTFFVGSERRLAQGALFAVAAFAAVIGAMMMMAGWVSWSSQQTFVPFSVQVWAWIVIAVIPLVIGAFHGHRGLIPIALAIACTIALPWCNRSMMVTETIGNLERTVTRNEPGFAAHAIVMVFALLLCGWGVRIASRALVNLSIVYFGITVAWFYFSNVFTKAGRSIGLIGFGVLFLAGGWMLEKTRRRLMSHMDSANAAKEDGR